MKDKVLKIFNILFFIVFTIIILISIINNNFLLDKKQYNGYLLILLIIILGLILILINNKIKKISTKKINILIIIVSSLIIIFQLIIINLYKVNPTWDFGAIYYEAINFEQYISFHKSYFSNYTNNIPILILLENLFSFFKLFNITNYLDIGIYFNMLLIDLSIFITCLLVNKIYDRKKVLFILVLFFLSCPIYFYVPIFYTDTITMIFPILLLYIYNILISNTIKESKKSYLMILFVILAYIGIKLKFTVIIIVIALLIFTFIKYKINIKKVFKNLLIVSVTLISLISLENIFYNKYINPYIDLETKIPYTHWIAMGLRDNGGYNKSDALYAEYMKDYEKEKQEEINLIKERINDHIKNKTLFKFLNNKIAYTWGDGTFYAPVKLSKEATIGFFFINNPIEKDFGEKFYYFNTSYHLLILIMIVFSSIIKNKDSNLICRISLFGVFLFLLMWEARSRYLINYIPIIILASIDGFENVIIVLKKLKNQINHLFS